MGKSRRLINTEGRECARCGVFKTWLKFQKSRENRNGYKSNCKDCDSIAWKRYKVNNLDKVRQSVRIYAKEHREEYKQSAKRHREKYPERWKNAWIRWKFNGFTLEDYGRMFEKQRGLCALCSLPKEEYKKYFCIDHDHVTKKVRGLVHSYCNTIVGIVESKRELLNKAEQYLQLHTFS